MVSTVLLVEDEVASADMLATFLEMHKYRVLVAYTGNEALRILQSGKEAIDLAILDIMVPGVDGRELCSIIRKHSVYAEIPVIFLTAKDEEKDEIYGLTIGADDYIPKPASLNLVLAHVNSLLRRRNVVEPKFIVLGEVSLNPESAEVEVGGQKVDFTLSEFRILELLVRNQKRVFSRQEILDYISDDRKNVFDRTIDVHIKNIRIKLGEQGALIKTFRGIGYGIDRQASN
jgi:DNA-binding response OmpR family regulator